MGFSLDLRASFPAIISGIVSELVRERGAHAEMPETTNMFRNLKVWRQRAAQDLSTNADTVKRGIDALPFGMRHATLKRLQGIPNSRRSPSMERIEREVIKARGLIVDHEISNHRAHKD